jgi:hypothetical protein
MAVLTKFRIEMLLLIVAVSSVLSAHSGGGFPSKPQDHPSVSDARQIVSPSIVATERSLQARDHYTYMERDEDRRLNSRGLVKFENVDVTRMMIVNGARFEQLVEHNGQLPSAAQLKKGIEDIEKLNHEAPEEQAAAPQRPGKQVFLARHSRGLRLPTHR